MDLYTNTLLSLTSDDSGFSYRKLLSLIIVIMVVYLHTEFASSANVLNFLLYDFTFICVLLGLLNLDRFIQAKYGSKEEPKEEPKDVV